MKHSQNLPQSSFWHFGKYQDIDNNLAFLAIFYPLEGKLNPTPLVMPFSKVSQPKLVINELMDAGADIDSSQEQQRIKQKLKNLDIKDGRFVQKIGHYENVFLLPPKQIGEYEKQILVDPEIAKASSDNFNVSSSYEDWSEHVAIQGEKSSFIIGGVCISLAAAIYSFVSEDENAGYNFCCKSGFGKTTLLYGVKSVIGSPKNIPVWSQTLRSTAELAAANSDCPLIIDDLEKLQVTGNKSQFISQLSHMLASGLSKSIAKAMGKTYIPLEWSCPLITTSPFSIEQLALSEGYMRTDGDRCRLMDIPIPIDDGKGIWDRKKKDDDPEQMSRDFKSNTKKYHGSLYPKWLREILNNRGDMIGELNDHIDEYILTNTKKSDSGFEHRVARKFAINYAAGMLAIDLHLLPWERKSVKESIVRLHNLALNSFQSEGKMLSRALNSVNDETSDCNVFPSVKSLQCVSFKTRRSASGFILGNNKGRYLYITADKLLKIVGGPVYKDYFLERMKQIGALKKGSDKRFVCQAKVRVGKNQKRLYFYKIELDAFDKELE